MGLIRTTLLGIVGSFVGGLLGALILGRDPTVGLDGLIKGPAGFVELAR